ncbi:hypothetical protein HG531_004606 [Fusarium graminearum]|nr:hypothetical protein HG531_004606 [Fusarium graminearum]
MLPNYYDPDDDVLPKGSPLLQPVQVRIKPETPDGSADELDLEDLDKPWNPALRDRKRSSGKLSNRPYKRMKDEARMDWTLVHHMSGKDPDIARAEAREPLPPNDPGWGPPSTLRRPRKRRVLPLVLQGPLGITAKLEACADSGSDENIISLEVARQMKLQIRPEGAKPFALANGKVVDAVGLVKLDCGFAAGTPLPSDTVACLFYVFNTLAVPLIMGMGFLTETKTLSEHTDRLIEQVVSEMQALKVNSVGNTKCSAPCRLNDLAGYAVVDTGSDLNFVHPRVVEEGKFAIEPASVYLEFADCSIGMTSGVINTTFSIGCEDQPKLNRSLADQQFYILDDLNTDILIGQDTTEELQVMTSLREELSIMSADSAVNIIRLKGNLEQRIRGIGRRFRNVLSTSSQQKDDDTGHVDSTELQVQRENAQMEKVFENAIIPQLPAIPSNIRSISVKDNSNFFQSFAFGLKEPAICDEAFHNQNRNVDNVVSPSNIFQANWVDVLVHKDSAFCCQYVNTHSFGTDRVWKNLDRVCNGKRRKGHAVEDFVDENEGHDGNTRRLGFCFCKTCRGNGPSGKDQEHTNCGNSEERAAADAIDEHGAG